MASNALATETIHK